MLQKVSKYGTKASVTSTGFAKHLVWQSVESFWPVIGTKAARLQKSRRMTCVSFGRDSGTPKELPNVYTFEQLPQTIAFHPLPFKTLFETSLRG